MRVLSLLGFSAFVLASFTVGARLLLLARRTRQVPELAIGLALLVGGGVGYLLIMLVVGAPVFTGAAAAVALFTGSACTAIGAISLAIGVRQIYRPTDRGSLVAIALLAVALAATLVGRALEPDRIPAAPWIFWTATITSTFVYLWSASESIGYWRPMRRRARIGLADASTVRRFLLWGISASAAVGMHAASMLSRLLVGAAHPPAWLMTATSLLGLVAAIGIWLAFFPPRTTTRKEAATG